MKKLFTNLTFWVLIAIIAAILVGKFAPQFALHPVLATPIKTKILGQEINIGSTLSEFLSGLFISIVKLFINPIIFLTITLGIVSMGNMKKVGRVGVKALLYFEIVTTFALIIGVTVALLIQPGHGVNVSSIKESDISKYTQKEFSWLKFLKDNLTLQVLLAALIIGIVLNYYKERKRVTDILQVIANYVFKALHK